MISPVPQYRLERRLPATPATVSLARRFVRAACSTWTPGPACDNAAVAVSELVTNVMRAGGRWVTLRLTVLGRRLRLEVEDDLPGTPTLRQPPPDAESGRGLWLIAQLSTRWGVDTRQNGKAVWVEFELEAPRATA